MIKNIMEIIEIMKITIFIIIIIIVAVITTMFRMKIITGSGQIAKNNESNDTDNHKKL